MGWVRITGTDPEKHNRASTAGEVKDGYYDRQQRLVYLVYWLHLRYDRRLTFVDVPPSRRGSTPRQRTLDHPPRHPSSRFLESLLPFPTSELSFDVYPCTRSVGAGKKMKGL